MFFNNNMQFISEHPGMMWVAVVIFIVCWLWYNTSDEAIDARVCGYTNVFTVTVGGKPGCMGARRHPIRKLNVRFLLVEDNAGARTIVKYNTTTMESERYSKYDKDHVLHIMGDMLGANLIHWWLGGMSPASTKFHYPAKINLVSYKDSKYSVQRFIKEFVPKTCSLDDTPKEFDGVGL